MPLTISPSESSSETDSDSALEQPPSKKQVQTWSFSSKFATTDEALKFVYGENTWSHSFTNSTRQGSKKYFRCNKIKKRASQCSAGLYLLFGNASGEILLFRKECGHTCESAPKSRRAKNGLQANTKAHIQKLFDLKVPPRRIMDSLREHKLPIENVTQLYNYLQCLKVVRKASAKLTN